MRVLELRDEQGTLRDKGDFSRFTWNYRVRHVQECVERVNVFCKLKFYKVCTRVQIMHIVYISLRCKVHVTRF